MFEVFAGFVALALGVALLFRKAKPAEEGDTARKKFIRAMASRFGGVILTLFGVFFLRALLSYLLMPIQLAISNAFMRLMSYHPAELLPSMVRKDLKPEF